jgi:hypothetical protein
MALAVACPHIPPCRRSHAQAPPLPDGTKWRTMEHNGVVFPPPYKPHGVRMLYNGVPVDLSPAEEEAATFYAGEARRRRRPPVPPAT